MTSPAPRPRTVLLVEDNREQRFALRSLLEAWGHQVREAEEGLEGDLQGRFGRPDAAVVDLDLPELGGHALAGRLRAALGDRVLLVALTGRRDMDDRERSEAAGFDYHLTKPADPEELRRILEREAPPPA